MPDLPTYIDKVVFAETNFRGERKRFGIKILDRSKHIYIIGKTGMGKSTLLENMTIQDIQAGRGVAVVDPHGEYAEKMLDFIPESRVNDVIYLNPADTDCPVAFNIMERVPADQRHFVAAGLLGVFKKIWGPEVWSARMEYLLANAILALLEIPGSTLLGINRMFGEKEFRKHIVSQLSDPVIKGFWENEFARYPEQFMREAVAAIQNKVGQFISNPLIRNIIGQVESSVDMRKVMDDGKIFIINLAKGRVGEENSRLLGAMLVTKLYMTAMTRVDLPESERKDFYLYVDEFQNFATESFASILSEARKYALNLTIAHQYMAQMDEVVQDAVIGNVGTMILFRVGGQDAEVLEKEFSPEFYIQDLVNLGFTQIYLKLMIDGITSRPFSAETLPPFPRPAESLRETIIRVSRERYGTPRSVVEEKIRRFTQTAGEEAPAAPAGRGEPRPGLPGREHKMYETTCAACGKPVMVPFQPDGLRPVYCQEHMDLVKFRSKPAPHRAEGSGAGLEPKPLAGKYAPPKREAPAAPAGRGEPRPAAAGRAQPKVSQPMKRGPNLEELRKALAAATNQRSGPHPETKETLERQKVLRPGETIRFE